MMTPPPINDELEQLEDEEEIKQRGFNRRVHIEQRALGFAAGGADGLPEHRGGRFAYQLRDEQRLKNVSGVPQAIVKVIPGGGVGSRGELVAQLNYLSRDGAQELERGDGPSGYQIEGQDAIRDVATDWAMAWEDAASRDGGRGVHGSTLPVRRVWGSMALYRGLAHRPSASAHARCDRPPRRKRADDANPSGQDDQSKITSRASG